MVFAIQIDMIVILLIIRSNICLEHWNPLYLDFGEKSPDLNSNQEITSQFLTPNQSWYVKVTVFKDQQSASKDTFQVNGYLM